jgi:hypothetical protein
MLHRKADRSRSSSLSIIIDNIHHAFDKCQYSDFEIGSARSLDGANAAFLVWREPCRKPLHCDIFMSYYEFQDRFGLWVKRLARGKQ